MATSVHFSIRQPAPGILRDLSRSLLLNLEGCSGKTRIASSVISDVFFPFHELIIWREWKGFNIEFSAFSPLTGETQRSTRGHPQLGVHWHHLVILRWPDRVFPWPAPAMGSPRQGEESSPIPLHDSERQVGIHTWVNEQILWPNIPSWNPGYNNS